MIISIFQHIGIKVFAPPHETVRIFSFRGRGRKAGIVPIDHKSSINCSDGDKIHLFCLQYKNFSVEKSEFVFFFLEKTLFMQ